MQLLYASRLPAGQEKDPASLFILPLPSLLFSARIFSLLSAILHLGNIRYKKKTYRDDSIDICNPEVLPIVSELLEVSAMFWLRSTNIRWSSKWRPLLRKSLLNSLGAHFRSAWHLGGFWPRMCLSQPARVKRNSGQWRAASYAPQSAVCFQAIFGRPSRRWRSVAQASQL